MAALAVLTLLAGGIGGGVGVYLRHGGLSVSGLGAGSGPTERDPGTIAAIAHSALPGVATLHVKGATEEDTGTGFLYDHQGHLVTNNHVVQPAGDDGEVDVTFAGGHTVKGRVVGRDSGYDLAVVKVGGHEGRPLPLGDSDAVRVGDPVVAIGAPFDLADTVTSGIISAKDRPIASGGEGDGTDVSYVDALQTDAPINPGNSGGPLLDTKGRVVGVNSAMRAADDASTPEGGEGGQSGSIGLGFAIPVNQVRRIADELIASGHATHPVIGVTLDLDYSGDGARVGDRAQDGGAAVEPHGPAAEAGLRAGDVVTALDGEPVHSGEELVVRVRSHRPGEKLTLTVRRDQHEHTVHLTLGSATQQ
ncbi:S1C family serine protease [Streptomyces sp. NPDC059740]|uniref:S1C family serine protease n=1 Tax=Streptomyces sp. NPDC059740 TaxID=3346926 RepID=UPI00365FF0D5